MARKHPRPAAPSQPAGDWSLIVFLAVAVVWLVLLMSQRISGEATRLTVFLVFDETLRSWVDGPVDWQGLGDRLRIGGVAALALLTAAIGGSLMIRGSRPLDHLRWHERVALATVLGLGVQSTAVLGLGLMAGLRHPWAGPIVTAATWLVCGMLGLLLSRLQRPPRSRRPAPADSASSAAAPEDDPHEDSADHPEESAGPRYSRTVRWTPQILATLCALVLLGRAALPPAEYDVREYHLQAPKEWWQSGEIGFLPHNIYANMPMAAEAQAVLTIVWWNRLGGGEDAWWWGALSGKLVIASYAILTSLLVGGFVRVLLSGAHVSGRAPPAFDPRLAQRWTRVFVLGFPALLEGTSLGLIEAAVAAFLAAGMLIAAAYRFAPTITAIRWPGLAAWLGFAAGGAVACKYPAVLLVVPALLILGGWAVAGREGSHWTAVLLRPSNWGWFVLMMFAGGGAWYLKNVVLAGNPVYPLLGQWLGGRTLTPEKIAQWNEAHRVPGYHLSQVTDSVAALLWRWRLQDWCVVPLVVLAMLHWKRRSEIRVLFAATVVAVSLWWLLTHRLERFLVPAFPLVFALAGLGVAELVRAGGARWATLALAAGGMLNMMYISSPVLGDSRMLVDLRYLRVDDLSASTVSRMPSYVNWVNQHLSPSDRLLLVGDAAAFDYEIPVGYSTTFDTSPLIEATRGRPEQWSQRLSDAGFTHVLVQWGEIARLRGTYGFDPRITPQLLRRLEAAGALRPIYVSEDEGGVELWQVKQR